jgi:2-polyprenyl-3-methyl-5-hydroxy-6-metoxy-1,4-benzoquinol methylase
MEEIEDRQKIWDSYTGLQHENVQRMFLAYTRYYEAELIANWLRVNEPEFKELAVLDYGCGVGDYGVYLIRQGVKCADFYDFPRAVNFVAHRLEQEKLTNGTIVDADTSSLHMGKYDLVIFGEVLEHLDDPLSVIKSATDAAAKYIFTSSYPYRSDDAGESYWQHHDHSDKARLMQPACRALLEALYEENRFTGGLKLWRRK